MLPEIQTFKGHYFNFLEPSASQIDIEDIAHSLSLICRFTGHTKKHYSVAQHSVLVSRITSPRYQLAALLHDASEAYIGDVSSPLKQLIPQYVVIEEKIERVIFEKFNISEDIWQSQEIKKADVMALYAEQRDLICAEFDTKHGIEWIRTPEAKLLEKIIPMSNSEAKQAFIDRFNHLTRNN